MSYTMAYLGKSSVQSIGAERILQFEPNLSREKVAFNAPLLKPLRFREGISALHDIVVSNLRYKPRDKSDYLRWRADQQRRLSSMRRQEYDRIKDEVAKRGDTAVTPDLEKNYKRCRNRYWTARRQYDHYLRKNDPELWRKIMPYDPVITVAEDVLFFECFSADESAYGCLTVDRDGGFGHSGEVALGTTNVDYSWDLYNHFQSLRSYRETRFTIDPEGFDVKTEEHADYREEKIDLPPGWLRGFMQLQGAMGMPMRTITLSRSCVYSLLAWLKRHKAKKSPRAIRFELTPGQPIRLVLEPWEKEIVDYGNIYDGPSREPIRIWGRDRLLVLARTLPLLERMDVYLLGTGLPSFWVAKMGEMRLTLGLSGWTSNDWTRGSALDLMAPPGDPTESKVNEALKFMQDNRKVSFNDVKDGLYMSLGNTGAVLNQLAHTGQLIFDLDQRAYRFRQILPHAIGQEQLGPPNPELTGYRQIILKGAFTLESDEREDIGRLLSGQAEGKPVSMLIDNDGRIRRAKCVCGHYQRFGIRNGPCRHMLALRKIAQSTDGGGDNLDAWYKGLQDSI